VPKTPVAAVHGITLPNAPTAGQAPVVAPAVAASTAVPAPAAGEYLVAVGLFASRERADALVNTLTQAGLPAMQRPAQLGQREVQQIVLGPFFSRSDAATDLQRLRTLGGFDDARVVASNQ
jgi:cell division septation protein DedD